MATSHPKLNAYRFVLLFVKILVYSCHVPDFKTLKTNICYDISYSEMPSNIGDDIKNHLEAVQCTGHLVVNEVYIKYAISIYIEL